MMDVPPGGPNDQWAHEVVRIYNLDIRSLQTNYQNLALPTKAPLYTVSQLTTSNYTNAPKPAVGRFAFCTNAFGSPAIVPVFSDGVYWRRVSNNAVIS